MSLGVTVDGSNGIIIDQNNGVLTINAPTTAGGPTTIESTTGDININAAAGYYVNIDNFAYTGPLILDGSAGTAGQFATSQGAGADAIWTTPLLSGLGDVTLTSPANGNVLQYNGTDWVNVSGAGIVPTKATNLAGGAAGQMPWQSAADTTGFIAAGSIGQVLISNGTSSPSWSNNAPEASNLAGGVAGSVVYQSSAGVTGYTAAGTSGQMLVSTGATPPVWGTTLTQVAAGAVITAGGTTSSPLVVNSTNTRGGAGFAEVAQFTNSNGGVTNPSKFLRLNNTGTLEIINDAYTATVFSVADSGVVTTGGAIWQGASQTNTNPNTGNNNGIRGSNGYITYQDNLQNIVLGDYTQTGHDTWIQSGRSIFFAPNGANSTTPNAAISAQLSSSGQFLIGTNSTTPLVGYGSPKLVVYSNSSSNDGATIIGYNSNNTLNLGKVAPNANGTGAAGGFIAFVGNGSTGTATYGNITVNGSGVSYNTSSDARLKENVVTLTGGLDKVKALRPVSYDWIDNSGSDIGFIAQEAELVVPESVTAPIEDSPAHQFYQMDMSRLIPVLTAAIKEQQAIIEALQARLDKAGL